jgi:hypothetical protein
MRFEKYLQEKYMGSSKVTYGAGRKKLISIYMNPTSLELKMAVEESRDKDLRFLADNLNKKVFVWSSGLLHWEVWEKNIYPKYGKGRDMDVEETDNILTGIAKLQGNKAVMMDSDAQLTYGRSKDIAETDWTWMNKYVNATQWLKKLRK